MTDFIPTAMLLAAGSSGIGSGRVIPTVAALFGLSGVIVGSVALARSAGRMRTGSGRLGAIGAGVAGLVSAVVGGLHWAWSAGGFGTGNGRAGAIVAVALGLISMFLGGLALARSRLTAPQALDTRPHGPDLRSGAGVGEEER